MYVCMYVCMYVDSDLDMKILIVVAPIKVEGEGAANPVPSCLQSTGQKDFGLSRSTCEEARELQDRTPTPISHRSKCRQNHL